MAIETKEINGREYTFYQIGVFEKSKMFARIQKQLLPAFAGAGLSMSSDTSSLIAALSERVTPELLTEIVLPMFKLAQVASVEHERKIDSPVAIDTCFDDMDDFFELIIEVAKYNFLPSLLRLMQKFGSSVGGQPQTE